MKHISDFESGNSASRELPDWVPDDARAYLEHVTNGRSMRDVARQKGGHASTISRHVQKLEARRDDPLIDAMLSELEKAVQSNQRAKVAHDRELMSEARRLLRRLCESTAFLVMAANMDKAAIMREVSPGHPVRTATLERHIAEAFALKDWIECFRRGKVRSYRITCAGQAALKRILSAETAQSGFAEATTPFQEQHKIWGERRQAVGVEQRPKRVRYNLAESPVTALGRRITQNWDRFLTMGRVGGGAGDSGPAAGPGDARARVACALKALGPGLGDIALRCCCFLEGMEAAEKRMGWSARSGKIVLRIALQRLQQHYDAGN
ncbi:MAG: helix-turn-helix domain-containing protein [Alphaproteobacteria bacterium]|nr:helix-turn-helix domain-containing protein [Alphaproteobacteria bacterium]